MEPDKSIKRPRVGIISIHPAPYRDGTFAALHRRGRVEFTVLTMFPRDGRHVYWNLDNETYPQVLFGGGRGPWGRGSMIPRMIRALRKGRFDVIVIPGYSRLTPVTVILYCLLTRTPYILSADKIEDHPSPSLIRAMAISAVRLFRRSSSAFWVPGKAARRYLCGQGIEDKRIFEGCYTLDYLAIRDQVGRLKGECPETRRRFSIDEQGFVFLMAANVIPKRRHDLLLKAFSLVVAECPNAYLLLAGDGADNETIARLSEEKGLKNICLAGPVSFDSLAPMYALADAYVHSGGEPYSTAVAYGAIAGLSIVTTAEVGAAGDYVIEDETGYLIDSKDVSGFADKMILLIRNRETTQRLGRNAGKLACRFTTERAAEQLEKAVAVATGYGNGNAAK